MSLIVSVYVPSGIVISGDSRTTGTISQQIAQPTPQQPNATLTVQTKVVVSDAANKVFQLFERFGAGTFGEALVNNMPIDHYVDDFESQQATPPASTQDLATALLTYFRALNPIPNIGFIVAGYDGSTPSVITLDLAGNNSSRVNWDVQQNQVKYGIIRGGDTAIVDRLLSQQQFNPPFQVMNLQDAVDYSRHLIRSTIDQLRYEPRFPTVGGPIDTLALSPKTTKFLRLKKVEVL